MQDEQIGLRLEQLGRQMHDGAVAAGGVIEPAGILAGVVYPLLDGPGRRAIGHQHDARRIAQMRNRREVTHGVVGNLGIEIGTYGMGAAGRQQKRVPISWRLGHDVRAKGTASPRLVVDHHRLTQPVRELLRDRAGKQIGRSARRKRHDQSNGLTRIGLRAGKGACKRGQRGGRGQGQKFAFFHALNFVRASQPARDRGRIPERARAK